MSLSLLRQFRRIAVVCLLAFISFEVRAANVSVQVGNDFFNQKDITVNVGDTVTWVWIGSGHDTVANDGTWNSGLHNVGFSFPFTFTAAHAGRRFDYFCTPHRAIGMVGSVTVRAAANLPPTVSLTSPQNGATFLTTDTITFSANANDPGGAVSKVEFFVDGSSTPIGADTSSPYSVTATLGAGSHSITAKATDNGGLSTTTPAITINVNAPANQPPTVSLTAPGNGQTFLTTDTITFSANANDDAGVNRVEFYSDGNLIGTDTSAPYSVTGSLSAGQHSITAKAFDGPGLSTPSGAITITVNAANQPPTVTLTSPANGATVPANFTINFTAEASDDAGVNRVEFLSDGNVIGTDTSAPYGINIALPPGQHIITARAVDGPGLSATSQEVTITVTPENTPPGITLSSPQSGQTVNAPATISLLATVVDNGAVTQVEFFQDGVLLGIDTTAPFEMTVQNLPAGVYNFTAVARDDGGLATASTPIQVQVSAASAGPPINSVTRSDSTTTIVASATDGVAYDLQATTNFVDWAVVDTKTAAGSSVTLSDTTTESMRFYRVAVH